MKTPAVLKLRSFPIKLSKEINHNCLKIVGDKSHNIIVCVHGFGNSRLMWMPWAYMMKNEAQFWLVDLPGFGENRGYPLESSKDVIQQYSEYLAMVMEQVPEDSTVSLVGYSLGAYIGLTCLSRRLKEFEKVSNYIHIDHSPYINPYWEGGLKDELHLNFSKLCQKLNELPKIKDVDLKKLDPESKDLYLKCLELLGENGISSSLFKKINKFAHTNNFTRDYVINRGKWSWVSRIICHYGGDGVDLRKELSNIKARLIVIAPKKESLFKSEANLSILKTVPSSEIVMFNGSHDLIFKHPIKFLKLLRSLLHKTNNNI